MTSVEFTYSNACPTEYEYRYRCECFRNKACHCGPIEYPEVDSITIRIQNDRPKCTGYVLACYNLEGRKFHHEEYFLTI